VKSGARGRRFRRQPASAYPAPVPAGAVWGRAAGRAGEGHVGVEVRAGLAAIAFAANPLSPKRPPSPPERFGVGQLRREQPAARVT
jgi:hypothetical protein